MKKQLREVVKCVTEELKSNYSARTNDNELILGVMKRLRSEERRVGKEC